MPCEICGRDVKVYLTNIEGATLYVCRDCNPSGEGRIKREFKKIEKKTFVKKEKPKTFKKKFKPKPKRNYKRVNFDLEDLDLVENYGNVLRKAREAKGLSLEDFAKKLKESYSYLHKIEQNKLKPNDRVLLKIYDFLGVSLLKEPVEEDTNVEENKETEINTNKEVFTEVIVNNKKKIVF